jgi:hypothetical protein
MERQKAMSDIDINEEELLKIAPYVRDLRECKNLKITIPLCTDRVKGEGILPIFEVVLDWDKDNEELGDAKIIEMRKYIYDD